MRDTLQQGHVTAAASLAPQIKAAKEQLDGGRRLPPELAQAIDDVDLFHLYLPKFMGGPEVTTHRFLRSRGNIAAGRVRGVVYPLGHRCQPVHGVAQI